MLMGLGGEASGCFELAVVAFEVFKNQDGICSVMEKDAFIHVHPTAARLEICS